MQLPTLNALPRRYPQCCASLSGPLLNLVHRSLPSPPALTLSVGSGSGLLEACLIERFASRRSALKCVEVRSDPPVNGFFPEDGMVEVLGTWDVPDVAEEATCLLFVYPRQPSLVRAYLDRAKKLTTVVWIGPRCDALIFEAVFGFESWSRRVPPDAREACDPGEDVMIFRRPWSTSSPPEE